jgi:poly(3-hydroxybutyrate) depolymerase
MRQARIVGIAIALIGGAACGGGGGDAAAPQDASASPVDSPSTTFTDATTVDASADADADASSAASRCTIVGDAITCEKQTTTLNGRTVTYSVPVGVAGASGWPAVLYFQGSFVPGDTAFAAHASDTFGRYQLTLTIKALLDRGYVVIAPDAAANGNSYWETNIPPYAIQWQGCDDDLLMQAILASIAHGDFGHVDTSHLYAMGISSGGFMTSRMAVSYAGKFRALADCSGSYATCGAVCSVPTPLPSDHPPTLFLHGDADNVVPMSIVQPYLDALNAEGHETKLVTDGDAGHEWLRAGPDVIPSWFDSHP